MLPKILFKKKLNINSINVTLDVESNRKTTFTLANLIEINWENIEKKARNEGRVLYNGNSYRLNSFAFDNEELNLNLSNVDYKTYITLKGQKDVLQLGEEYFPKPIYVASMIKTTDSKYVFAELSGKTMEEVKYDFIGGILSIDEIKVESGKDILKALDKEFEEEAGLSLFDINQIQFVGITQDEGFNIGFHFSTHLNLTSQDVQRNFEENHDAELKNLIFIDEKDVVEFLDSLGHEHRLAIELNDLNISRD